MFYNEFVLQMKETIQEKMGDHIEVTEVSVEKVNNISLRGLAIKERNQKIAPTIYLEAFYERWQAGTAFEQLIQELIDAYRQNAVTQMPDVGFMMDYEKARKTLAVKLINLKKNTSFLKDVAFMPYLNLAIVFYCRVSDDAIGAGTITIKRSYLEKWNISMEQLCEDALKNAQEMLPCRFYAMEELMKQMENNQSVQKEEKIMLSVEAQLQNILQTTEENTCLPMMIVAANSSQCFGASVLLYQDVLKTCASVLKRDLYILPSSIHEIIILPKEEQQVDALLEMVKEVNSTQVEPEEWLADAVYYYDASAEKIMIAGEAIA